MKPPISAPLSSPHRTRRGAPRAPAPWAGALASGARPLALAVLWVSLAACPGTPHAEPDADGADRPDATIDAGPTFAHPARVLRILDGDTIQVEFLGQTRKVRFEGIDTPEMSTDPPEPYAAEATHFTTDRIPPTTIVGLEFDDDACGQIPFPAHCFDIYDRLLAYIRTPAGEDLNALLLAAGLARVYTAAEFGRKTEYLQIEAQARDQRIGIWSQ